MTAIALEHQAKGIDMTRLGKIKRDRSWDRRWFLRHGALAFPFILAVGPARAVERIRVEATRRMLEQGMPIKRVAARCGFGSEETMRRSFLRLVGATPRSYRDRFSPTAVFTRG